MMDNKTIQLGIVKEIEKFFTTFGETRQKRLNIFNLRQDEIQLLLGMATDIRVILHEGVVTIHPMMIEGSHDKAWDAITCRYLNRVVLAEDTKEVFLE